MGDLRQVGGNPQFQRVRSELNERRSTRSMTQERSPSTWTPENLPEERPREPLHRRLINGHWQEFSGATLADLPRTVRAAFEHSLEDRLGLYLDGPVGSGKTHALVAMFDALASRTFDAGMWAGKDGPALWRYLDMLAELRADYDRGWPEYFGYFCDVEPLFIDDLGAGRPTEWVAEQLVNVFDYRKTHRRLTYVTGNLRFNELGSLLNQTFHGNEVVSTHDGDRLASRLAGMCTPVHFTGRDRRMA